MTVPRTVAQQNNLIAANPPQLALPNIGSNKTTSNNSSSTTSHTLQDIDSDIEKLGDYDPNSGLQQNPITSATITATSRPPTYKPTYCEVPLVFQGKYWSGCGKVAGNVCRLFINLYSLHTMCFSVRL